MSLPSLQALAARVFLPWKISPCYTRVAALHTEEPAVRISLRRVKHFVLSLLGNSWVRFAGTLQIRYPKETSC